MLEAKAVRGHTCIAGGLLKDCYTKKALEISSALVHNLLRKVIGSDFRFALSMKMYKEIASTLCEGEMLFLFVIATRKLTLHLCKRRFDDS